jgi:hypothetical protein
MARNSGQRSNVSPSVVPHVEQNWTPTLFPLPFDTCSYVVIGTPENATASMRNKDSAYEVDPVTRWQNLQ